MLKNFIFDLDGTIINSSKEILTCFDKAFKQAGVDFDQSRLNSDVIGPPLKEIIRLIAGRDLSDSDISNITSYFREIYDNDTDDVSELYAGIYDFLLNLKKSGYKLFIATFKPDKPTKRIVSQFGLSMFDDLYSIDKFGKPITKTDMILDILEKYNLEKSETVMIGDALSDVQAAKKAGVLDVAVLWGYGKDKSSLVNDATYVVNNIEELNQCLKLNCQII